MSSPLSPQQQQQLRRQLLNKGADLNEKLVQLLGGDSIDVNRIVGVGRPGERPEERLRRFLNLIDRKLAALRSGSYGGCESCGSPLSFVELEQLPWAERCRSCSALPEGR